VAVIPTQPPSQELARALAAHGQLLKVSGRHAEARARCEEAVAVARRVGARAVEGHALSSLGVSLGILGHLEEGVADLEQGRRIALELANVDDLAGPTPTWPPSSTWPAALRRPPRSSWPAPRRRASSAPWAATAPTSFPMPPVRC
jgi:hypothetical protein